MDKNSIIGWSLMAVLMILLLNTMNRMKKEQLENMPATEQVQQNTDTSTKGTTPLSGDSSVVISNTTSSDTIVLTDSLIQQNSTALYGIFANAAHGTAEEIVAENDVLKVTFSTKGAIPVSVILKNYKTHDQQELEVV